jgi:hypothetical protein
MKVLHVRCIITAATVCSWMWSPAVTIGQSPTTPPISKAIERVAAYVNTYAQRASVLVATERYNQTVTGPRPPGTAGAAQTVAEFAIVKTSGSQRWIGFRDVVEADGKPITDHRDRLLSIVTDPAGDVDQARRLSDESARFNIGPISRNFNVPTTALLFFIPENLKRFSFKLERVEGNETRISYRETHRPTLIRTPNGTPVATGGELFADNDGVVHRTILRGHMYGEARGAGMQIEFTIDVRYTHDEQIGMWLPSVMTEEYISFQNPSTTRIETRADYSNYRRFETSVRIK